MVKNLVDKNENVWRKNAVQETRKFLDMKLIDRAATRQLEWGVPVPVEGYEDKRIYVWFEAVLGYLTAGSYVAEERNIDFNKFICDDENLTMYLVHGKDNIPFHIVMAIFILIQLNYYLRELMKKISKTLIIEC